MTGTKRNRLPSKSAHPTTKPAKGRPADSRVRRYSWVLLALACMLPAQWACRQQSAPDGPRQSQPLSSPALQARLRGPSGITVDADGNLYIADRLDHRVCKVDPEGMLTVVAGTGESGFAGDGGPAVRAQLSFPAGVAVDADGNLYIADSLNRRVRKVDAEGIVATAERPRNGGTRKGAAVDADGNLYVADWSGHRILKIDGEGNETAVAGTGEKGFSGDGGPALAARLNFPRGVALDGNGAIYVADWYNHRIRKIDAAGTISTVAGSGDTGDWGGGFSGDGGPAVEARLFRPRDVALDAAGAIYIADTGNHRIRKIDAAGIIATAAGAGEPAPDADPGPALEVMSWDLGPEFVAVDGAGDLYF